MVPSEKPSETPSRAYSTTATLDHTAFPHVMKAIVSYASPEALVALRGTSKAYLELVNTILFAHVAWRSRLIPERDFPSLSSFNQSHAGSREHGSVGPPFSAYKLRITPPDSFYRLPYLPHLVKTIDLHGRAPTELAAIGFRSLRTIRRLDNFNVSAPHANHPSSTVVDFRPTERPIFAETEIVIPDAVARAVIHVQFDETQGTDLQGWIRFNYPGEGKKTPPLEIVFVLWPMSSRPCPAHPGTLDFVLSGILNAFENREDVTITVVGMEDVAEVQRANTADALWAQYSEYAEESQAEETERDRIRLVTREEWWAELGDRKESEGVWPDAAWETIEDLPSDLPPRLWGYC